MGDPETSASSGSPNVPVPSGDLFEQIESLPESKLYDGRLEDATARHRISEDVTSILEDANLTLADLGQMLLTEANGKAVLQEQRVEVQYLKEDQKLVIPAGLGMHVRGAGLGRCVTNDVLRARYKKMTSMPYDEMFELVKEAIPDAEKVARLDSRVEPSAISAEQFGAWPTSQHPDSGKAARETFVVYTKISSLLQMNFDVRDFGILNKTDMFVSDDDWMELTAASFPKSRLSNRLKPYSLVNIAALNFGPCEGYAMGAWVRAYGVGCGILPAPTSQSNVEWTFTTRFPVKESRDAVAAYEKKRQRPLHGVCLNVLGMFGLFHLNKDHTFKTGDQNMIRIGTSWLQTIRTMTDDEWQVEMVAKQEVMVRTAPHPFGLAQTYWVAKVLAAHGALASPLMIRTETTPPPVQRIMIANAARNSWSTLPAGVMINDVYASVIEALNQSMEIIKKNPVKYSGLARLYGMPDSVPPPQTGLEAANMLMPVVYGYAEAVYTDEANKRTGLALALSLENVKRDFSAIAKAWAGMWSSYVDQMDKTPIVEFARVTRQQYLDAGGVPDSLRPGLQRDIERDTAEEERIKTLKEEAKQARAATRAG